jgi:hypothetical protein
VVTPLANLRVTKQVSFGDVLIIDWDRSTTRLSFKKDREAAAAPMTAKPVRRVARK